MNRVVTQTAVLALLACALGLPACSEEVKIANETGVTLQQYSGGQLSQFDRLDTDQDKAVDYTGLPRKLNKRYGRMDLNEDGTLTRTELQQGVTSAFDKADTSRDGVLQPSEQH